MKRRTRPLTWLLRGAAAGILALALAAAATADVPPLLDPLTQPQFVNPLPNPLAPGFVFQLLPVCGMAFFTGCDVCYWVGMYPIEERLGLIDPATGMPLATTVWGYSTGPGFPAATYPGRTFVVRGDAAGVDNEKVCVQWTNDLVNGSGDPLLHLLPLNSTLH